MEITGCVRAETSEMWTSHPWDVSRRDILEVKYLDWEHGEEEANFKNVRKDRPCDWRKSGMVVRTVSRGWKEQTSHGYTTLLSVLGFSLRPVVAKTGFLGEQTMGWGFAGRLFIAECFREQHSWGDEYWVGHREALKCHVVASTSLGLSHGERRHWDVSVCCLSIKRRGCPSQPAHQPNTAGGRAFSPGQFLKREILLIAVQGLALVRCAPSSRRGIWVSIWQLLKDWSRNPSSFNK